MPMYSRKQISLHIIIIIIIMVIFQCREHISLSYKKWCEHGIRKNQQIKGISS